MAETSELLSRFANEGSDSAFGELIKRYIDLVYSTALRRLNGDAHRAEDVTQTVFLDLARKARSLPADVVLGGWLYRDACFRASETIRTERRRQIREQTAAEMNALNENAHELWKQIAPMLEDAMERLSSRDRDAIILRFFEQRDLRAVGASLGVNEDAAQKRVTRAVEKLRVFFTKRGITLSAAGVMAALSSEAVVSAPAGLAVSVIGPALAGAATGSGVTLSLIKVIIMNKLKASVVGVVIAGSLTTLFVVQRQSAAKLRNENVELREQADRIGELRERNKQLFDQAKNEEARIRDERSELMRLRGEVGQLRRETGRKGQGPGGPASGSDSSSDNQAGKADDYANLGQVVAQFTNSGQFLPKDKLAEVGANNPVAAMQSYLWALTQPDPQKLKGATTGISPQKLGRLAEEFSKSLENAKGLSFGGSMANSLSGKASMLVTVVGNDGSERNKRLGLNFDGQSWVVTSDEWAPEKVLYGLDSDEQESAAADGTQIPGGTRQ